MLFTFRIFEQIALALKNRGCPEFTVLKIHLLLFRSFEQLALALKNRVALEFFTVLNILFTFRIFEQFALALKNRGCPWFTVLNMYFLHSEFLSNLRLSWKTELSRNFSLYGCTFYIQNFWATCACPEKRSVPWIHCTEYIFFIIQEFWVTCACPEKQSVPWIHCTEYVFFIIQEFWAICACPDKRSCPGIFHCSEIYFTIKDFLFLSNLRLPWKQSLPWNFQARRGDRSPRPPPRTPMLSCPTLVTLPNECSSMQC